MIIIKTTQDLEKIKDYDFTSIAFDTETNTIEKSPAPYTLLQMEHCSIYNGKEVLVFDFLNSPNAFTLREVVKSIFKDKVKTLLGHNLVFDLRVLSRYNIFCNHIKIYDTMVAQHLIDEEEELGLKALAVKYLDAKNVRNYEESVKLGKDSYEFYQYASNDALWTWKLAYLQQPTLKQQGLVKLFREIEMPFLFVILDMEINGLKVDTKQIENTKIELNKNIEELTIKMLTLLNKPYRIQMDLFGGSVIVSDVNFNSGQQLATILYKDLGLPQTCTTESGQPSVGKDAIESLKGKHEFVSLLYRYKIANKLLSAFFNPLPSFTENDGRVRAHFNDCGTATGRLSCNSPNLQQLPKLKKEFPIDTRKCFIVEEDEIMISADYSGQELRVLAHITKEPTIINSFIKGKDLHLESAKKFFSCDIPDEALYDNHPDIEKYKKKYKAERDKAKIVNFGIAYGKGAFGFSQDFNISEDEAGKILDRYFSANPLVRQAINSCTADVKRVGYVTSITGRRRRFKQVENNGDKFYTKASFRQAFNFLIQGYSADMIRIAGNNCYKLKDEHPEWRLKFLATIHDEILFSCKKQYEKECSQAIKNAFETAVQLVVPLISSIATGKDYGECK